MQTLYGIRVTDRVTVTLDGPGPFPKFKAHFDGEEIGTASTGAGAVNLAKTWLKERQERREAEAKQEAYSLELVQAREDDDFLNDLAKRLGIDWEDMDRLINIIERRATPK